MEAGRRRPDTPESTDNAPGKEAMNDTLLRRVTRRLGLLSLACLMVVASAGLAYVAHLTQVTTQSLNPGSSPSVLPLIALSILSAVAGLGTFKYALEADAETV